MYRSSYSPTVSFVYYCFFSVFADFLFSVGLKNKLKMETSKLIIVLIANMFLLLLFHKETSQRDTRGSFQDAETCLHLIYKSER